MVVIQSWNNNLFNGNWPHLNLTGFRLVYAVQIKQNLYESISRDEIYRVIKFCRCLYEILLNKLTPIFTENPFAVLYTLFSKYY